MRVWFARKNVGRKGLKATGGGRRELNDSCRCQNSGLLLVAATIKIGIVEQGWRRAPWWRHKGLGDVAAVGQVVVKVCLKGRQKGVLGYEIALCKLVPRWGREYNGAGGGGARERRGHMSNGGLGITHCTCFSPCACHWAIRLKLA